MKTCSIIVPVYNVEPTLLKRCIDSVKKQTYPACELILADDGSDTPVEGAIRMPHRGQGATRNAAMPYATGEYIMFLDADDYLEPDCVERCMQAIGDNDYLQFQTHFRYRLTSACMRLYRRAYIEQHGLRFPEGVYYEDVYWSVQLWLTHPSVKVLPYKGYYYYKNPVSITSRSHPADQAALFRWLAHRRKRTRSLHDWLIVSYTILRLRIHFLI